MLAVNADLPAFSLFDAHGQEQNSASWSGKWVILYFYPKDNTPGCTTEACDFRDRHDQFAGANAIVVGISKDSSKSHAGFATKYTLPFHLLSDPELTVHGLFGAYGKKVMYGKETQGTIRSTFLVNPAGKIAHVWPKVTVNGHAEAVLQKLTALQTV